MDGYEVRLYKSGDEEKIVSLLTEVFGHTFTIEEWKWKYLQNPMARDNIICLAFNHQEKLIGHFAGQTHLLNLLGKSKKVINCVDGAVHPHHQGSEVFASINSLFRMVLAEKTAIKTSLTIPGEESLPYVLRLGTNLFMLKRYLLEIPSRENKIPHKFTYSFSDNLNLSINSLWETVGKKEILSFKRDDTYLKWRYNDHPCIKYTFHYLMDEENILAFAVTRDSSDLVDIVEIMSKFKMIDLAIILKQEIIKNYIKAQITSFKFIGRDPFYYDQVFEDFGVKGNFKNFVFSLANDQSDEKIYENRENWTLTLSNQDMV